MVSSTPRPHITPGKDPVPVLQEAGWAPGQVWMGGKSRPHRDSIPDRPARNQSLYRLSCPAHFNPIYICLYLLAYIHSQPSKSCVQLRIRTPGGSDCRKHTVIVKQCNGAHVSVGTAALTLTDETLLIRSITCYFNKLHFQDFWGLWGAYSAQIQLLGFSQGL